MSEKLSEISALRLVEMYVDCVEVEGPWEVPGRPAGQRWGWCLYDNASRRFPHNSRYYLPVRRALSSSDINMSTLCPRAGDKRAVPRYAGPAQRPNNLGARLTMCAGSEVVVLLPSDVVCTIYSWKMRLWYFLRTRFMEHLRIVDEEFSFLMHWFLDRLFR